MTIAFDRRTISGRLTLISAAFTFPIVVMLYLIVTNINREIEFTALELNGNEYQRPLEALLDGISEHRLLAGAGRESLDAVTARVDQAFDALQAVDARVGRSLQFTDEGLAQRKREHIRLETVRREWQQIKAAPGPTAEQHLHLIADVRTMITHAGDTSNLILDPDLDSYYTMDATLVALPQNQDRTAAVTAFAQGLARRSITDAERIQLAVYAATLRESDVDRVMADVQTALSEDGRFQGTSVSLQRNLPAAADAYRQASAALTAAIDAAVQAPAGGGSTAIVEAGINARHASFAVWRVAADELDVLLQTRLSDRRQARAWAIGLSVLAWLAALLIVLFITRGIIRPLAGITGGLSESASQVVAAAGQVATSSQSLSQGATEQAASLEETSASMEEMASMARANAQNTHEAAGLMAQVDQRVTESNQSLSVMVASMAAIEDSSARVAKIIKTIDQIAFQTNILALNAAVEAARAGDAGMGFAVVADEVRSLAQRSAQAAKDTAGLIDESIAKARDGSGRVDEVARSIGAITDTVARVKRIVEDVSEASRQQTQGIDQVSQAIAQMEKVTQGTAATAEESAAASEELNAQAESTLSVVRQLELMVGGAADVPSSGAPKPVGSRVLAPVRRAA